MLGIVCLIATLMICGTATGCAFFARWFGRTQSLDASKCFNLGLLLGPIGVISVAVMSARTKV